MTPDQLRRHIDSMFVSFDGPPMSYFDWDGKRYVYQSYILAMRGEVDNVGSILCDIAKAKFDQLLTKEQREDRDVALAWRTGPHLASYFDERGAVCTSLRMRLVIPGIDMSPLNFHVPEGEAPVLI